MINIEWYVYYYDVNRKKIDTYNIFEHSSFKKEFSVLLQCDLTKEVFADQLRHINVLLLEQMRMGNSSQAFGW